MFKKLMDGLNKLDDITNSRIQAATKTESVPASPLPDASALYGNMYDEANKLIAKAEKMRKKTDEFFDVFNTLLGKNLWALDAKNNVAVKHVNLEDVTNRSIAATWEAEGKRFGVFCKYKFGIVLTQSDVSGLRVDYKMLAEEHERSIETINPDFDPALEPTDMNDMLQYHQPRNDVNKKVHAIATTNTETYRFAGVSDFRDRFETPKLVNDYFNEVQKPFEVKRAAGDNISVGRSKHFKHDVMD